MAKRPGRRPRSGNSDAVSVGAGKRLRVPVRLGQLYLGLSLYGVAGALQVRSRLGLDPWNVLHQGLARHLGIAIGTTVILVGAAVLVLWIPLRQVPGLGTLSNVVLIGVSMNESLNWLPHVDRLPWRVADMVTGVLLCGVATGMYIGANFGPGPRDGLMTGIARRTGRSIRLTRTGIEVTVLAVGWLLGGTVGVGTVLFAVSIGPLAQLFLPIFAHDSASAGVIEASEEPDRAGGARAKRSVSRLRQRAPTTWRTGRSLSRSRGWRRRTAASGLPATPD